MEKQEVGDTGWFTMEPVCIFCKQDFEFKGNGYNGYSGFVEAKCGCRSLSVNQDVLKVMDALVTSAEKSLILNGFVRVKRGMSGTGQYARSVVDVESTVTEVREVAKGWPEDREELVVAMNKLRIARLL